VTEFMVRQQTACRSRSTLAFSPFNSMRDRVHG
jgi:hypothetical protein